MKSKPRMLMTMVLLVLLALVGATSVAASAANGGGLVVVEQSDEVDALAPAAVAENTKSAAPQTTQERVPEFVATDEWKEILPGQGIPRGLHVRMNLETGKKEAKLMDPTDVEVDESMRSVVVEQDATVTIATDVSGEIDTVVSKKEPASHDGSILPIDNTGAQEKEEEQSAEASGENADEAPPARWEPAWNHEKIYEVLQALPEPPTLDGMDIYEAHAKLSKEEFRKQIITLWKQRQKDLKDAMDTMQDDAKYLGKLLEQFRDAEQEGNTDEQLNVLEVLEWEVQDLDKTHIFHFIGGFDIISGYLNSTNLRVRAGASWVIGTASKSYRDGQNWAIDAGALPKLIQSLALDAAQNDDPKAVFEVKKKALYALSSLVLFNDRGQRLFLLHNGLERLAGLFDGTHPKNVQLKVALLIHDLLLETTDSTEAPKDRASLQQIQESLKSIEWCARLSSFFLNNATQLRQRQALEVMGAMRNQLPSCQETFQAAGVKQVVDVVATSFAQDEDLDEEEKQELLAFVNDFLGFL
uniref:Nucleotide exchange factor Fes1 domain-containing protein n=1 Tax=Globisporangium ultimum (strain ATCC 200006 / CBS 805.95 / DAOM BR144) TaxID=431595 RepID=K3WKB0_GLOUD